MRMVLENGIFKSAPENPNPSKAPAAGRMVTNTKGPKVRSLLEARLLQETDQLRVCVYRSLGGIGDILMITPTYRAIKHEWPTCHLTAAIDFKYANGGLRDILQGNPYIDELITYQTAGSKDFDVQTDITSVCLAAERKREIEPVPNRIDVFAGAVGVSLTDTGYLPDIILTPEETKWAFEKLLRVRSSGPPKIMVGICPRSSTNARSWPIQKWRNLIGLLTQDPRIQVCVMDSLTTASGPKEEWNIPGVEPLNHFDIRKTAALINEMDIILCNDSAPLHIAAAFNKKTVCIFAGTDFRSRVNHYPNAVAVARADYACYPCFYTPKACGSKLTCMESITPAMVQDALNKLIDAPFKTEAVELAAGQGPIIIRRDIGGIGDVLCTECAARALKARDPAQEIIVSTPAEYHCIFENNPAISKCILPADTNITRAKLIYNLTRIDAIDESRSIKAGVLEPATRPEIYLKTVGIVDAQPEEYIPKLYIRPEDNAWVDRILKRQDLVKFVGVILRSAEEYRTWPLDHYIELFKLAEAHPELKFVLLNKERWASDVLPNTLDCNGFGLKESIMIASKCDLMLTPDTSFLHIAAALNKPTVAIFGPIPPVSRCKYYKNFTVLRVDGYDCMPCWRNGKIKCKRTQNDKSACLLALAPKDVLAALLELAGGPSGKSN